TLGAHDLAPHLRARGSSLLQVRARRPARSPRSRGSRRARRRLQLRHVRLPLADADLRLLEGSPPLLAVGAIARGHRRAIPRREPEHPRAGARAHPPAAPRPPPPPPPPTPPPPPPPRPPPPRKGCTPPPTIPARTARRACAPPPPPRGGGGLGGGGGAPGAS